MNNKQTVICATVAILIMTMIAGAANQTVVNATVGNTTVTGISNYTSPKVLNASNQSISLAENLTIGKVGVQYFHEYMSYRSGYEYLYDNGTNVTIVFMTYNIPFANGTTTEGIIAGGPNIATLGAAVLFDDGNVLTYVGPSAPYIVNVTANEAFAAAKQFGLNNVTGSYLTAVWMNSTDYGSTTGYALSWAVFQKTAIPSNGFPDGKILGVYVGTDKPVVNGEFLYNPAILASLTGVNLNNNLLGNFTAFNVTNIPVSNSTVNQSATSTIGANSTGNSNAQLRGTTTMYGVAILIIAILIAATIRIRKKR